MALRDIPRSKLDEEMETIKDENQPEAKKGLWDNFTWRDKEGRAGGLSKLGSAMMNIGKIYAAPYGTNLPGGRDIAGEELEIRKEELREKNLEKRAKMEIELEDKRRDEAKLDRLKATALSLAVPADQIIGEVDENKLTLAIANQQTNLAEQKSYKYKQALEQQEITRQINADISQLLNLPGLEKDVEAKERFANEMIAKYGVDQALSIRRAFGLSGSSRDMEFQMLIDRIMQEGT